MIAKNIENHIDKKSWYKLLTSSDQFTSINTDSNSFFDGPKMLKIIMNEANPDTIVGVQNHKDHIKKHACRLMEMIQ